jgi:hypothetical protein
MSRRWAGGWRRRYRELSRADAADEEAIMDDRKQDESGEAAEKTTNGAYTDSDREGTHRDEPGGYTDVEREDGSVHKHVEEGEPEGEYTDTDRS